MSKSKRQVTLDDNTIAALEQEGIGSLSTGIELMHRAWSKGSTPQTHHKQREKTFDLPDDEKPEIDSRNPTSHQGTANRLAKEDAAKQVKLDNMRAGFRNRCLDHFIGSTPPGHLPKWRESYSSDLTQEEMDTIYNDVMADQDGSGMKAKHEFWAARKKHDEEQEAGELNYKMMQAINGSAPKTPQTTRLSAKALKGLSMFGTPETMTDEQIKEINTDWENRELPVALDE